MDDLRHGPGRWLIASKSIEQFFDMRRWDYWFHVNTVPGVMDKGAPFAVHLSPSVFMSCYQERSMSFDIWFFRRLERANNGLVWRDVVGYESAYEDTDEEEEQIYMD